MLVFYLVTTGVSFGIYYLSTKAYGDYLERKGYVDADGKRSSAELGFMMLSLGVKALIPIYNICTAAKIVWDGSKHFDEMAADDLKKGSIRKLTDEEIEQKEVVENEDTTIISQPDDYTHYHEMTREEKLAFLEKEKEFLLQEKENESLISSNDNEEEKARIRKYYTSSK